MLTPADRVIVLFTIKNNMQCIYWLESKLVIIENDDSDQSTVQMGRTVTFIELPDGDEEEYTIVGSAEADPFEGKISNDSPIAKSLLGCEVGQEVNVPTPGGDMRVRITEVK